MALCGCWIPVSSRLSTNKQYLPQLELKSSTKVLATTTRTELQQTFVNSTGQQLSEVQYTFPLYDGVSVVGFKCTVASKVLIGVVKEKNQARTHYSEAVARGETAGLLEQIPEASDAFTTTVGNVARDEKIIVNITYLGELKHDAETDGSRFTIPTIIAPRYGSTSLETAKALHSSATDVSGGISISVDVELDKGSIIRGLQSPSHPIAVTMGRNSLMHEDVFEGNFASAQLTHKSTELTKDFVLVVSSKDQGQPRALLESHPTIPGQRAVMATLVPKFNLPNIVPEIVFVVDRSGSMQGNINIVISALKIFLKSLPLNGIKFNICSFGSRHSFLFPTSTTYDQSSLDQAVRHINGISADYGGTEILRPVQQTCEQRYKDMPLEVMLLTDGQIHDQEALIEFINKQDNARFFSMGIGSGASSALVEGVARAGNGFGQFVDANEKMDKRVVRMLKAALTPHVTDYKMTVNYGESDGEDFEILESSAASTTTEAVAEPTPTEKKPISLFDSSAPEEDLPTKDPASRYHAVPSIATPTVLQAPHKIPQLYPFARTTVYLLLSPPTQAASPISLTLHGTSPSGPLELTIPIQKLSTASETIHQLAAKKAVHELEQGRGWLVHVDADDGKPLKEKHEGRFDLMVERECVRLGTQFQVGGKYTSFVAVERTTEGASDAHQEYEVVMPERPKVQSARRYLCSSPGRFCNAAAADGNVKSSNTSNAPGFSFGGPASPSAGGNTASSSLFGNSYANTNAPGTLFGSGSGTASTATAPQANAGSGGLFGALGTGALAIPPPPPLPQTKPEGLFGISSGTPRQMAAAVPSADYRSQMERAQAIYIPTEQSFNLDFSTLDNNDALAHFDFDAFLNTSNNDAVDFASVSFANLANETAESLGRLVFLDDTSKMHKLIEMQRFDGSWPDSEALWKLLVVYAMVVRAKMGSSYGAAADEDNAVVATVAAVAWLRAKMQGEQEVWEMVAEKAVAWLKGQGVEKKAIERVMDLL